jgi:hypothetical protein
MRWPYKVKYRKNGPVLARIYKPKTPDAKNPNPYPLYRVTWMAAGKRLSRTFRRFAGQGGAKEFAEGQAKDLATGSQVAALTPGEARSTLAIRDVLENFRRETGETVTPIQAITEYVTVRRQLGKRSLSEAATGFLSNVVTIKRVDLSAAVEEFAAAREIKSKSKDGRRAQLSSSYTYNTGLAIAASGPRSATSVATQPQTSPLKIRGGIKLQFRGCAMREDFSLAEPIRRDEEVGDPHLSGVTRPSFKFPSTVVLLLK